MFLCYGIAWLCDLDYYHLRVSCRASHIRPTYQFYYHMTIRYWVTSTKYLFTFRYLKQSLRKHRVTWPLTEGKNSPHFWNPWPQFAYSFSHFHGAIRRRLGHVMGKNSVFPLWRYKVYCASRDLCIGGPRKPHVTIFWPRIAYSLYNFYAATMTIKGSLY